MGKNKFKNAPAVAYDEGTEEVPEDILKEADEKPVVIQTVYTHNKKFKIPAEDSVEEFLKKQFPEEYK